MYILCPSICNEVNLCTHYSFIQSFTDRDACFGCQKTNKIHTLFDNIHFDEIGTIRIFNSKIGVFLL